MQVEMKGARITGSIVKHAIRSALRGPGALANSGFTLAVMLVLALGIGANSAVLSALDQVVIRPCLRTPKSGGGLDPSRAEGGLQCGGEHDGREQDRGGGECRRVPGADAEQER
jgi:hypothetical protein